MAGVSTTNRSNSADADGVTVTFNFTFFAYTTDTIKVYSVLNDVLTPITSGFTTTINSSFIGGSVVFTVAPADAVGEILIRREVPYTQTTEIADLTLRKESEIEEALNTLVLQIQQVSEEVGRAIKYSDTANVTDAVVETPVDLAVLTFNGTTGRIQASTLSSLTTDIDTVFSGLAAGDMMRYNGTAWSNRTASETLGDLGIGNGAAYTFLGNNTASAQDPVFFTAAQATAILSNFIGDAGSSPLKGLVPAAVVGDADKYKVLGVAGAWVEGRKKLTADTTFYVRKDGDDSNNGLTDDADGAFLTIQACVNYVMKYVDCNNYQCTIQVRSGTYSEAVVVEGLLTGQSGDQKNLRFLGDTTTPSNVVISITSDTAFTARKGANVRIAGFKLTTTTSGNCMTSSQLATITVDGNMDFGAAGSHHIGCGFLSHISLESDYTVSGDATYHYSVSQTSYLDIRAHTVTFSGSRTFSAFAVAQYMGQVFSIGTTFTGTVTGQRYNGNGLALIFTNGGGANYFPGNSAGAVSNSAIYL